MKSRLNYKSIAPEVFKLMIDNEEYIGKSNLDPKLKELVKIRASEINGCASCLHMHIEDSKSIGETDERIYSISVWRETNLFSPKEQAALALTEIVTEISRKHLSSEVYQEIRKHFDDKDFIDLLFTINNINNWNRINIINTPRQVPEIY